VQEIFVVLMPFLILYARKMFAVGSQDIGNFLILKVIGGILTGSVLFYYSKRIKYRYMMYIASILRRLDNYSIRLHTFFCFIHPYNFIVILFYL